MINLLALGRMAARGIQVAFQGNVFTEVRNDVNDSWLKHSVPSKSKPRRNLCVSSSVHAPMVHLNERWNGKSVGKQAIQQLEEIRNICLKQVPAIDRFKRLVCHRV